MRVEHVLLCCLGAEASDDALRRVTALSEGAKLSVVVPVVETRTAEGCCGIGSSQWERLMDEHSADALRSVVARLESLGRSPAHAEVVAGRSLPEILEQCVAAWDCDAAALSAKRRPWSTRGISRRRMRALRRRLRCECVELGRRRGAAPAS
jgi:nucleotide-binding universal stress UspA family protein